VIVVVTVSVSNWNLTRVVGGQLATLPVAAGRCPADLNVRLALPARRGGLWAVTVGRAYAWVLIVELARDARYLPFDGTRTNRDR
jgi:hypothetical protein